MITQTAFTAADDWTKLLTLTQLQGIGQPTASAILHLTTKNRFHFSIYTHCGLSGCRGQQGTPIRSGWTMFSFAATLRTETMFQCGISTGHCGSIRPTTGKRDARGNMRSNHEPNVHRLLLDLFSQPSSLLLRQCVDTAPDSDNLTNIYESFEFISYRLWTTPNGCGDFCFFLFTVC